MSSSLDRGFNLIESANEAAQVIERVIKELQETVIDIDVQGIPRDDEKTFAVLQRLKTTGVFLFESKMHTSVLRKVKPDCLNDLIALVALCRPGPLDQGWDKEFAKRKSEGPYYDHPALETVLRYTYGMILFQEQVLEIAGIVAGFSERDSKAMLQAILKRDWRTIERFHRKFVDGADCNYFDRGDAEKLWWVLMNVSKYTLSKANAERYARIAYQMAYLKAHYPAEFAKVLTE